MRIGRIYCALIPLTSLFISFGLFAKSHSISVKAISCEELRKPIASHITLEHATQDRDLIWGLMQRKSIPDNHGMTFNFALAQRQKFWSFNCFFDLSVAYLDEEKILREIIQLKAYPEMMDPKRPVQSPQDLALYPKNDPIVAFFVKHSSLSSYPSKYALEMKKECLASKSMQVGDVAFWNIKSPKGLISHSIDTSTLDPNDYPLLIVYPDAQYRSVLTKKNNCEVIYLNEKQEVIQMENLQGNHLPHRVLVSKSPARYTIIAHKNWTKEQFIEEKDRLVFSLTK